MGVVAAPAPTPSSQRCRRAWPASSRFAATAQCRCCGCRSPSRASRRPASTARCGCPCVTPTAHDLAVRLLAERRPHPAADSACAAPGSRSTSRESSGFSWPSRAPTAISVVVDDGNGAALAGRSGRSGSLALPSCSPTARPRNGPVPLWQVLWAVSRRRGRVRPAAAGTGATGGPCALRRSPTRGSACRRCSRRPCRSTRRDGTSRPDRCGTPCSRHAAVAYADLVRIAAGRTTGVLSLVPVGLAARCRRRRPARACWPSCCPRPSFLPAAADGQEQTAAAAGCGRPRHGVSVELVDRPGGGRPRTAAGRVVRTIVERRPWRPWGYAETADRRRRRCAGWPAPRAVVVAGALRRASRCACPPGRDRDDLGALPVPLADGRLVTGARGVVRARVGCRPPGRGSNGSEFAWSTPRPPIRCCWRWAPYQPRRVTCSTTSGCAAAVEESMGRRRPGRARRRSCSRWSRRLHRVAPGELPWLGQLDPDRRRGWARARRGAPAAGRGMGVHGRSGRRALRRRSPQRSSSPLGC